MRSGIDPAAVDPDVRPQDDLFAHVNGRWLATTRIPEDRGRYGTFDVLRETAEEHVRAIIEEVAAGAPSRARWRPRSATSTPASWTRRPSRRSASARSSTTSSRSARCRTPLTSSRSPARCGRGGVLGLVIPFVNTDDRDPSRYVVYLEQAGLGLPDESYYREDAHADKRTAYVAHVERMLSLAGWPDPEGAAASRHGARDPAGRRPLGQGDRPRPGQDLHARRPRGPHRDGARCRLAALPRGSRRRPRRPSTPSSCASPTTCARWPRPWPRSRSRRGATGWRGTSCTRTRPTCRPRSSRRTSTSTGAPCRGSRRCASAGSAGVSLVEECAGRGGRQLYVERHFPPHAKERMVELVDNLVEAFRRSLSQAALDGRRHHGRGARQARPVHAQDRLPRPVARLLGPRGRARRPARQRAPSRGVRGRPASSRKLGGPVDRDEWFMTPQTVNAYYNPGLNEIVFPAAILQPPFFDVEADDAVNYGGIGAVIGHEIGHGFDDQGSQYDGTGNLRDWWTDEDRAAFEAQRRRAHRAVRRARAARRARPQGQRRAHRRREHRRPRRAHHRLLGLPHLRSARSRLPRSTASPGSSASSWAGPRSGAGCPGARRPSGCSPSTRTPRWTSAPTPSATSAEFHEAFGVGEGDGMWLAPDDRVRIF